jgi:hypothetical protein
MRIDATVYQSIKQQHIILMRLVFDSSVLFTENNQHIQNLIKCKHNIIVTAVPSMIVSRRKST